MRSPRCVPTTSPRSARGVDRESGRISDGGAYGSVPWLDLEDGYRACLVIEADSGAGGQLAELLYDVIDEVVAAG